MQKETTMNTRSFTAALFALATLSLGACASPAPEQMSDSLVVSTANYFSEERNIQLQVTHTGVNIEVSQNHKKFFNIVQKSEKDLDSRGYESFSPQGRLGIGPLSGRPHLNCVVNIKLGVAGEEVQSFTCSPSKTEERGLGGVLDAIS